MIKSVITIFIAFGIYFIFKGIIDFGEVIRVIGSIIVFIVDIVLVFSNTIISIINMLL